MVFKIFSSQIHICLNCFDVLLINHLSFCKGYIIQRFLKIHINFEIVLFFNLMNCQKPQCTNVHVRSSTSVVTTIEITITIIEGIITVMLENAFYKMHTSCNHYLNNAHF